MKRSTDDVLSHKYHGFRCDQNGPSVRQLAAVAGPSAGRDRVLAIRRSRSPQHSLIKDESAPLALGTPSRRAGTRALPIRGSSTAYVDAHRHLPDESHVIYGTGH